ncbi:MAG TPA: hypothetical protein VGQ16_02800 [Vicinamibacterales bacterium]|jgi:hypothetical protein|nr:hypothetical protein [Vicinamibacterales bacterium]
MFIENLSEHEIGTMIAALKHFRASRDSVAQREHRSTAGSTVNELLIKLEGSLLSSLTSMDPALHGLVFNR